MNNRSIKKKIVIIIIIAFVSMTIIIEMKILPRKGALQSHDISETIIEDKNIEYYIKYIENNKSIIKSIINDRYIEVHDYQILIGNNKKEIENEYFDIKIFTSNNEVFIYINKLFKNFDSSKYTINSIFIDKNYLNEIIELINIIFNLKLNDNEKEKISSVCFEKYMEIRSKINLDNVINIQKVNITISKFNFMISLYDNMLLLNIKF